jgi:YesN/AraC family two-component response regulator
MLWAFVITSACSFVANLIGRQQFVDSLWLLAIPSTLFSILLFTIGYIGHNMQFSIEDIEADEQKADEVTDTTETSSELCLQIQQLMKKEELFRQPNLKIVDIVKRLGTNRNYIYLAINRELGVSFSTYVNKMRIEYAERLIVQQPDLNLGTVGERAGFTSNTSFYRNFKIYRGISPKEYQKRVKKTGA